jgi:hypothetical protein
LSIKADYAKLVWPFVSADKERFFLNGFYVQRHPLGGAVIVATDGRSLGAFWDQYGEVKVPAIIRLNKTTLAACDEDCTLVLTGDRAGVYQMWNKETGEGLLVAAQDAAVIEGDFPDWREIIPPFPRHPALASFAFPVLKKFEKVRRFGSKISVLRVFASSDSAPAIVLTERDDFLGIIMPYSAVADNRMPQWMPRPVAAAQSDPLDEAERKLAEEQARQQARQHWEADLDTIIAGDESEKPAAFVSDLSVEREAAQRNPYAAGRSAAARGFNATRNPFNHPSIESAEWLRGHAEVEQEMAAAAASGTTSSGKLRRTRRNGPEQPPL